MSESVVNNRSKESQPEFHPLVSVERSSLTSQRSEFDDYWYRVLALCDQRNPAHFGLEFPSAAYTDFEYIDSGTYSHVIKAIDRQLKRPVVFKIIKIMQSITMNKLSELSFKGFELFTDVYQEIVIIKTLSSLHEKMSDSAKFEYQAHSFPRVYRTRVVHGEIPNYFLVRRYDESVAKVKQVERFEDAIGVPREALVIVMKFGGDSLWERIQARHPNPISPDQLISLCYQVVLALAVAELYCQFEHRDLHVCNILVKPTKKRYVLFKLRSQDYRIKSFGVKACIIDATFSRMSLGGDRVYSTDLTSRLKGTASNLNPDGQDKVYQMMYHLIGDRWTEWFPQTNIYWLKYCFEEIATSDAFLEKATEAHKETLRDLSAKVVNFTMVSDFIAHLLSQPGSSASTSKSRVSNGNSQAKITRNPSKQ